jgi:hypothetical protein
VLIHPALPQFPFCFNGIQLLLSLVVDILLYGNCLLVVAFGQRMLLGFELCAFHVEFFLGLHPSVHLPVNPAQLIAGSNVKPVIQRVAMLKVCGLVLKLDV